MTQERASLMGWLKISMKIKGEGNPQCGVKSIMPSCSLDSISQMAVSSKRTARPPFIYQVHQGEQTSSSYTVKQVQIATPRERRGSSLVLFSIKMGTPHCRLHADLQTPPRRADKQLMYREVQITTPREGRGSSSVSFSINIAILHTVSI